VDTVFFQRIFWSLYGWLAWDAVRNPAKTRVMQSMLDWSAPLPRGWVLDAGCGTGDHALALARAGFDVTGIDYAEGMLARARSKTMPKDRAVFQKADLNARLPFDDESFDCAISMSVLFAVADPFFTLAEIWRILKPGGALLLTHVPKHTAPLQTVLSRRLYYLTPKTPITIGLVVIKVIREYTRQVNYWSVDELREMLYRSGYQVMFVEPGSPVLVHALKPSPAPNRVGDGINGDFNLPRKEEQQL